MTKQTMLSIWFFVGLLLSLYGFILTVTGIYYFFYPYEKTVLYELNPSFWWGLIILSSGIVFLVYSCIDYKKRKNLNNE